jgi:cytochrome P450
MLGKHPDVEARLHEELSTAFDGRPATAEGVATLPYMRSIVDETLRMYPPVHFIDRRPLEDVVLGDTSVKAGSYMLISPLITQRDPRFFSEPARFLPERWLAEARRRDLTRLSFPFGAGAHGCLGEALARLEISLTLATLARDWRLRPSTAVAELPSPQTLLFPMTLERRG